MVDQETANALYSKGAILILLDTPPNTEFGIDCYVWRIGENFRGIKLIPPGVHTFYFSPVNAAGDAGPRTGYFHNFKKSEIIVKKWNALKEEYESFDIDNKEHSAKELDRFIAPYPLTNDLVRSSISQESDMEKGGYAKWIVLSQYITPHIIDSILPDKINSFEVTTYLTLKELHQKRPKALSPLQDSLNELQAGSSSNGELINVQFTKIDLEHSYPKGAMGMERTRWSRDKSFLVRNLILQEYRGDYRLLLGEFQLSFLLMLLLQVYDGFEQWKVILQMLCNCDELISEFSQLFKGFLDILEAHLADCPPEMFYDIATEENFIRQMLKTFITTVYFNHSCLVERCDKLLVFLGTHFGWKDLKKEIEKEVLREKQGILEEGEDAPVVVEL